MCETVKCVECGTEQPKWINFIDTADGTQHNVWWCKECYGDEDDGEFVVIWKNNQLK